jgi:hypothetical protein
MSQRGVPCTGHVSNLGDPAAHYLIIYPPAHSILMISQQTGEGQAKRPRTIRPHCLVVLGQIPVTCRRTR